MSIQRWIRKGSDCVPIEDEEGGKSGRKMKGYLRG